MSDVGALRMCNGTGRLPVCLTAASAVSIAMYAELLFAEVAR